MATEADARRIMFIMEEAHRNMKDPDAYITDDLPYILDHIRDHGFTLVAEAAGEIVGFFLVCIPGLEHNNLGYELGFSEKQLMQVALMDSAAVLPEYQGKGIMGQLFRRAVELTEQDYPYLLGTVAPDNTPSRRNFEKNGFSCLKVIEKYGGKVRCLMGRFKDIPEGCE